MKPHTSPSPGSIPVRRAAAVLFVFATFAGSAFGQASLTALSTFGSSGWLQPNSITTYVSTANNERGFAYNHLTKNLVVPSTNGGNFLAVLNGTTGNLTRTLDTTGVSGGTRAIMAADVSEDGAIYVTNLQSGSSALSPFKVYKWTSESDTNAPTVAFSQVNPQTSNGAFRFGDVFAVRGNGTSARFITAGSSSGTTSSMPNNGNFMVGTLDGSNSNTIYRAIPNTLTASNDYRLGLTWVDGDTIIGNQGTSAKVTDFLPATTLSGTGANITATIALGAADRQIDYTFLNGMSLMAVLNTANSVMSVYDITNVLSNTGNATLLTSGSTVSGSLVANGNASGNIQWGEMLSPTSQVLYGMSTNQGIQAMVFSIPEPSVLWLGGLALAGAGIFRLVRSRRRG